MKLYPLAAEVSSPVLRVNSLQLGTGEAAWVTLPSPAKQNDRENEDAVAAIPVSEGSALLAVADGLGGHRGGRRASQALVTALQKAAARLEQMESQELRAFLVSGTVPVPFAFPKSKRDAVDSRSVVLDQIEKVNRKLLRAGVGAGTTLALVETCGNRARTYHIGDSEILIVSQRGRIKYETVSHSPIGYAVEAGLLSEEEALLHEDRHLVSNVVGSPEMSIELGPWIKLAPRDTVLLASDGLFDNLRQSEIIEGIRKGRLAESIRHLALLARERMVRFDTDLPGKPDDLTLLAFRRLKRRRNPEQVAAVPGTSRTGS